VCHAWRMPDHGIWEPRGAPERHTHSLVLAWTALDRLLELAALGVVRGVPRKRYENERTAIRFEIETRGWNPSLRSYVATLDGDTVDASLVLLAWYGFHEASHPRMKSTLAAISARLEAAPGLFYRNEESPGLGEGAFGICCAWVAECLARGGATVENARSCFENLLLYANDVGLFGEEIDPASGEALGNFPQAFTHVGLIGAALALEEARR
jgi:GH15 family glucan-1,4-alpha-glucosidase